MNEIQRNIREAMGALTGIPVRGDDVERMAAAKINLRIAFRLAGEKKDPDGKKAESGETPERSERGDGDDRGTAGSGV